MMHYYGIDCGLSGGVVCLDADGKIVMSRTMPILSDGKSRVIDIGSLATLFAEIGRHPDRQKFIVENPGGHAPSAAGLRSMTYSYAVIETLLVANKLQHHIVTAQRWQKQFWSRPQMAKGKKFNNKAAALLAAGKIWPAEQWLATERCRKAHDGMVDAALIAEYGRRQGI